MSKTEYPSMPHYEHFRSKLNDNKIFFEDQFKNCIQTVFNKDGSVDLYDFETEKHLKHYNS